MLNCILAVFNRLRPDCHAQHSDVLNTVRWCTMMLVMFRMFEKLLNTCKRPALAVCIAVVEGNLDVSLTTLIFVLPAA